MLEKIKLIPKSSKSRLKNISLIEIRQQIDEKFKQTVIYSYRF
jgi:hypothetical protein